MTPHRTDWLTSIALGIQSAVREAPETDGPGRKSIGFVLRPQNLKLFCCRSAYRCIFVQTGANVSSVVSSRRAAVQVQGVVPKVVTTNDGTGLESKNGYLETQVGIRTLSRLELSVAIVSPVVCVCRRTTGFEVRSKSVTLKRFVDDAPSLISAATELLEHEFPVTLRLMGVRMTHFEVR
jgi:hypothetical protein